MGHPPEMSGCDQLATTAADGNNLIEDEAYPYDPWAVSTQPQFLRQILQNITPFEFVFTST